MALGVSYKSYLQLLGPKLPPKHPGTGLKWGVFGHVDEGFPLGDTRCLIARALHILTLYKHLEGGGRASQIKKTHLPPTEKCD